MESRIKVKDWPFLGQGQFLRIIRENIDHIGTDTVGLLDRSGPGVPLFSHLCNIGQAVNFLRLSFLIYETWTNSYCPTINFHCIYYYYLGPGIIT